MRLLTKLRHESTEPILHQDLPDLIGLIIVSTVVMLLIGSWLTTMIDGPKGMNLIILQWFTTIGAMLIPGYWLFKQVKSTGQQAP